MRESLRKWKQQRLEKVLKIVSNTDASGLYRQAIGQALCAGRAKTGVQFFIPMVEGLRKTDTTFVRRALHDSGIALHHRDLCYIEREQRFAAKPKAHRIDVKKARAEGLRSSSVSATRGQRISDARRQYKQAETAADAMGRYQRARWFRRLPKTQQNLIRSRISRSWPKPGSSEYKERCISITDGQLRTGNFGGPKRLKRVVDGVEITFDSFWDLSMFLRLRDAGVKFRYANLKLGTRLWIHSKSWRPDFIIGNTIIEVKGHPQAYEKFYGKDLPNFLRSPHVKTYNVFLFEDDIAHWRYQNIKTLDAILSVCREVYRC